MLNINYPKIEKINFPKLELKLIEPINKLNLRGKNRDFFTKAGKILSIMLPTEPNTSASIKKINATSCAGANFGEIVIIINGIGKSIKHIIKIKIN